MKFYKNDLTLDYCDDNEIKLLIPYVIIETTKQVYGVSCDKFQVTIEGMWNLVTASQNKLKKREQQKIVDLFKQYLQDDTLIDFNSLITLEGYQYYSKATFIKVEMKDITTIFIKSTLAKLPKHLAILLNIQSYFDGDWIYLGFEELVIKITEGKYSVDEINWEKPNLFKKHTAKELAQIKGKFIVFNTVENILTTRYSSDKNKLDAKFLARDNFDNYIKELEQWGIICKVQTNCGAYENKVVFCRVEHKEVVEQYYIRVDEIGAFAEEQPVQPKQSSFVQQHRNTTRSKKYDTRNF